MSEEENKVSDELFKDVKFYVVGDIDQKVVQLLKAGKGKEVSYNALATHIIAEDGDNPEVGESREVFDLPVVKVRVVPICLSNVFVFFLFTGFSPESGQIFFGVTACLPRLPDDLSALWAYITFYGGDCQLNLNKKVTHLVVKEPKGAKFECALKHPGIKIVTPDWITDSVKDKGRKDETLYHPRLTYVEPDEEEESEAESYDHQSQSDGSYSPRRSRLPRRRPGPKRLNSVSPTSPHKPERRSERMFDDSDDDSSTEKEGTNLNWTPAEVVTPAPPITTGTVRRRVGPPGTKDPVSSTGSGLINLCATVPPVPGSGGAMPAEARAAAAAIAHSTQQGVSVPESMPGWSPAVRTLRNITNNSDMQPANRPASVHVRKSSGSLHQTNQSHAQTPNSTNTLLFNQSKLTGQPLTAEQQQQLLQQQQSHQAAQQHQQLPQQPQHPMMHLQQQHQIIQLQHQHQQQQSQVAQQQGFPQLPLQQQQFLQQQQQIHQQMFSQQQQPQQQQQQHAFSQQQLRPQQLLRPGLQQLQQQQVLQQQLQQFQQQRMQMLQQQQQNQQQMHQQHLQQQQQQHFLQQQQQMQQKQQQQHQQALQQQQHQQQTTMLQPQLQQPPHVSQLFGHEPGQESELSHSYFPLDGFLLGCVFVIADYPEQMADKQLLATWKRNSGGTSASSVEPKTCLLCQALREGKRCVTAHWLNTVLKKKRMVPPHRTLHLPFAFPPGAKPCSQHIISVTGFVDADRDDLKLMAYLAGARYTGYLCRSNTVLICKEPNGLKYEKAKEWKIPCVNAQWLCDILLGNFEALRQIQHSRYSIYTHPEPLVPNPQLVQNLLGIEGPHISADCHVLILWVNGISVSVCEDWRRYSPRVRSFLQSPLLGSCSQALSPCKYSSTPR
uniref:PAX-interacting protein 1 n=1 Tax=Amphilophus citrinellus TaxID=61819 RepID=A0A3Q0RFT2_AMPCI